MSKTIMQAVDEARKLLKHYEAINTLIEMLEKLGPIEQAEKEIEARIEKLRKMDKEAGDSLAATIAQIEAAKDDINHAKAESVKIKERANIEASRIISNANTSINENMTAAQSKLLAIDKTIAEKRLEVEQMDIKVSEANKELDKISNKVNELRSKAAKIMDY